MIEVNNFEIRDKLLPEAFDNSIIVHVSDLHSANFGKKQSELISLIKHANPHMIAITGDLIDLRYDDIDIAMDFIEGAVEIAPTFYVTGNHEAWTNLYEKFEKELIEAGVILLRDKVKEIKKENQSISIIGLDDPAFFEKKSKLRNINDRLINAKLSNDDSDIVEKESFNLPNRLKALACKTEGYTILLSHRPEFFKDFVASKINLVLAGHTHGGQVRFPLLGNIYSPNQGLFPKYSDGLYEEQQTKMIINRGLGNSSLPFRLNNPPEIIKITLKK